VPPPRQAVSLTPQRLHAELLKIDVSGALAYLHGAAHDATISHRHRTVRFGQADRRWLSVLALLLGRLGYRSWTYREGRDRQFWVLESSARWLQSGVPPVSDGEKRAYARGYFDAEGGLPRDPAARFYVQLVQRNYGDIANLRTILEEQGIACGKLHNPSRSADPRLWRFYVAARAHRVFAEKVSSWHPRKRGLLEARFGPTATG
jgi:hypothetical protein